MNKLFTIVCFVTWSILSYGQKIQVLSEGISSDSSFYHLAKISDNEYWAGGEQGILKRIDTLGNVRNVHYPNQGHSILKILRVENDVYVATDNSVIYRYDMLKGEFSVVEFKEYKNRCFYDLIALESGEILVCGGTSTISKAAKKLPNGFISVTDRNLSGLEKVWSSYRKFAWSLNETEDGRVQASTFNGKNSRIWESKDLAHWNKREKVKGLIHELRSVEGQTWYSGTGSIRYKRNGILGQLSKERILLDGTGCIWSMEESGRQIYFVTVNSDVMFTSVDSFEPRKIELPSSHSLYDLEIISPGKLLTVGHGKSIYLIDLTSVNGAVVKAE